MSRHLTKDDRIVIETLLKEKRSQRYIAQALGVSPAAICKEIKRGTVEQLNGHDWIMYKAYKADAAQKHAEDQNTAKGAPLKIGHDKKLADHIEDKILNEGFSPAAVLLNIELENLHFDTKISRATIYNYIDSGVFLKLRRKHLLRGERKQRKEKVIKRPYKLHPDKKSIEVRPTDYMQRNHFGHWEMDTVIGQLKGKNNVLLVLSERKTRHELIIKVKDKTAKSVTDAVAKLHKKYGNTFKQVFKSITVDNGVEFQDYKGIQEHVSELYYCHPYSSWERGTNENINAMIRRFIPKGKDMNKITHKEVERIQDWINNYPRAILRSTAQREFDKELQNLKFAQ